MLVPALIPALKQLAGSGLRLAVASSSVREFSSVPSLTNNLNCAGPGGRSSISGITATVFGANGFVGSYICSDLARKGSQIIAPFRSTENDVQHLKQMGDLGQMVLLQDFDISDEDMVKYAISRSNVVINLIGQRMETMNYSFEDVHVRWPERLAKIIAQTPHVERFLHFSEIGVAVDHPSRRYATKAQGDALVREITPNATIVRPGPVVGIEDYFYNPMVYNLSYGVLAPVVDGGESKVQPTWVRDVAEATAAILRHPSTKGDTVYLPGPETLTLRQVYDLLIETLRLHKDDTIHVPKPVAKAVLGPLDKLRRKLPAFPMDSPFNTSDNVEESTHDRVAPANALSWADLGLKATKVTDGLPMEPVRHFRVGGYRWGDMASVAKDVPESIRKYYNIK